MPCLTRFCRRRAGESPRRKAIAGYVAEQTLLLAEDPGCYLGHPVSNPIWDDGNAIGIGVQEHAVLNAHAIDLDGHAQLEDAVVPMGRNRARAK